MGKPRKKINGHTKACGAKQAFASMERAEAASKRGRWDFMQAYKCKKCWLFHYGHPSAKHLPR
jgi:hypothetical protein